MEIGLPWFGFVVFVVVGVWCVAVIAVVEIVASCETRMVFFNIFVSKRSVGCV